MDSKEIFVKWAVTCYSDSEDFKHDFFMRLALLYRLFTGVDHPSGELPVWEWFTYNYTKTPEFEKAFTDYLVKEFTKHMQPMVERVQELMNMGGIADVYST